MSSLIKVYKLIFAIKPLVQNSRQYIFMVDYSEKNKRVVPRSNDILYCVIANAYSIDYSIIIIPRITACCNICM